jgi:hypothetical protein
VAGKPHPPDCMCGVHVPRQPWNKGRTGIYSAEALKGMSDAAKERPPYIRTPEHRARQAQIFRGRPIPEEQRHQIAETMRQKKMNHRRYWMGGADGEEYARILLPAGYVREHCVWLGHPDFRMAVMDFAHLAARVDIELDGIMHIGLKDGLRDSLLKAEGWRVIRIRT